MHLFMSTADNKGRSDGYLRTSVCHQLLCYYDIDNHTNIMELSLSYKLFSFEY